MHRHHIENMCKGESMRVHQSSIAITIIKVGLIASYSICADGSDRFERKAVKIVHSFVSDHTLVGTQHLSTLDTLHSPP